MKFTVAYSKERDTQNYLNTVWKMQYKKFGREDLKERLLSRCPESFKKDLKQAKGREAAREVITRFLDSRTEEYKNSIQTKVNTAQGVLNKEKNNIISLLEKTYNKKFPFKEITVYITTLGICPYNFEKRWYMITRHSKLDEIIVISTHELNHFMFFYYYYEALLKRGFNDHKLMVLKEALAICTNPEGNSKPEVKELESFIEKMGDKPMDEIIEAAIASDAFIKIKEQ